MNNSEKNLILMIAGCKGIIILFGFWITINFAEDGELPSQGVSWTLPVTALKDLEELVYGQSNSRRLFGKGTKPF